MVDKNQEHGGDMNKDKIAEGEVKLGRRGRKPKSNEPEKLVGDTQSKELGFRRNERGELQLNPKSMARIAGGRRDYGWGIRLLVNNTHHTIRLPAMERMKVNVNGVEQTRWVETGEHIIVLPLQVVEYFEHAMNAPNSPFVPKLTPDDSEYTLTEDQAIEHLKKFPDISFKDASEAYIRYTGEKRAKVLNFILQRNAEIDARRKELENM